jgi:ubiquitin
LIHTLSDHNIQKESTFHLVLHLPPDQQHLIFAGKQLDSYPLWLQHPEGVYPSSCTSPPCIPPDQPHLIFAGQQLDSYPPCLQHLEWKKIDPSSCPSPPCIPPDQQRLIFTGNQLDSYPLTTTSRINLPIILSFAYVYPSCSATLYLHGQNGLRTVVTTTFRRSLPFISSFASMYPPDQQRLKFTGKQLEDGRYPPWLQHPEGIYPSSCPWLPCIPPDQQRLIFLAKPFYIYSYLLFFYNWYNYGTGMRTITEARDA